MNSSLMVVHVVICSGNCGAHTLRLAEYLLADQKRFDWTEDDMATIREKMAVEVCCNSQHNSVV